MQLVVDTNVFLHALNPGQPNHAAANEFLIWLLQGTSRVCVDPGVDLPADQATSKIWCEYRDRGLLDVEEDALIILIALFEEDRIDEVQPADIPHHSLRQCLYDKTDHVFFKVACTTEDHVLVSHDHVFWPGDASARKILRALVKSYGVEIYTAADALANLAA